ncbi:MAG: serine hydrolase [Planctomycetota bacterium]
MKIRRPLLAFATMIVAFVAALAPDAQADPQTDTVTPTGWWWMSNVTVAQIQDRINLGYRIVDIEVEDDAPFRLSATFVRNVGDYAKGWWWYFGLTASDVNARLSQNNARLIDVEPYDTVAGIRYAVVMIPNSGSDFATSHGWHFGFTFTQVSDYLSNNPGRRILDVQPYLVNGSRRYAFAWVANSGQTASGYWIYLNVTAATISSRLATNQARLIDLEPHDGTDRFSAIMVPRDGNAWWYYFNVPSGDVDRIANQLASRIIDLQRYQTTSGATRFSMVLRRNDNDLAVDATLAMRQFLPLGATSGFMLREYQGTPSTMAGVFENRVFESASLMKTVHHFVANRRVFLGQDSFFGAVSENTGLNGSCPNGSNPTTRSLGAVLRSMMEQSSNTATEAIRARYGTNTIESTAALFGATNVELNHTLGCLCGQQRNEITLGDLADLHGAVIGGALGSVRDDFYDRMSNGSGFGMGSFSTASVLTGELNASSLSADERNAFLAGTAFAHKGGSYTCGGGSEEHRSRGAYVRLPHRSGCGTVAREYFIGAWVNDATSASTATGQGR